MSRLGFGAFLAPHHPIGEHPMLEFRRDLDLVEHLDKLGYDEFWCGEHHSSGWEMIGSPEMFLAAAGERSKRIKLATGVVSLPYHHPFNVAQRMVQLDYMTGGRVIFGSGPGALASDAHTLGIDPMLLRDRQDEAIGVIRRLMRGERLTVKSDWFTLKDAALQLLPLQEDMPFAVASQISPSGMTLAGKHGIGIISIGSLSQEGLNNLPTQWSFAEAAAAEHGQTVDRRNWRVLMSWHIAETRGQARAEARNGLLRHNNEYITATLQRPGARLFKTPDEAVDRTAFVPGAVATIGTPDDLVARIKSVLEISGGFGTVVGFVHDWANPENTMRSWDMVARGSRAGERVRGRHAEPVRAEEQEVGADIFPARAKLLVAFLGAAQHEAVAKELGERLPEGVPVGQHRILAPRRVRPVLRAEIRPGHPR